MPSITQIVHHRRRRRAARRVAIRRSRIWALIIGLTLGLLVLVPAGTAMGGAAFLYWRAVQGLPTPAETIYLDPIIGPTELYDRDGQVLLYAVQDPLGNERVWITLDELPPYVAEATLLMEDPGFLQSAQADTGYTLTQLWTYMLGTPVRADRTLTGRLVRNAVIPQMDRTLDPQVLEIVLVAEINRLYTPQQILEWHLNTNYYGNDAYGIDAAARVYLGKPAHDLTLDEAVLLAAIPPAPRFNPFDNETAARGRQNDLLRTMLARGTITQAQFETAAARLTPLRSDLAQVPLLAPEFALYARDQAHDILDSLGLDGPRLVSRGGLHITTTLDLDLYYQTECTMRAHLASPGSPPADVLTLHGQPCTAAGYLPSSFGAPLASPPDAGMLVVLDVASGEIRSMAGPATQVAYQPGPTLQPFVYFEGFISRLFTPATMLLDIPHPFPGPADGLIYTPTNPDGLFRGPMNLRDAMASGLLPPAVYVANNRGLRSILVNAHRIGLNSLDENTSDLSLLERGGRVSLLDLVYAYSVFASQGVMQGLPAEPLASGYRARNPVAVLRITDAAGQVLWEYDDTQRVLDRTIVFEDTLGYLVNHVLADNDRRESVLGLANNLLRLPRPTAVVNGITGDRVDNWTLGYTPRLVVGVHLGRGDRGPMDLDTYGFRGSAAVWRALMEYNYNRDALPANDWPRPDRVVEYVVCSRSGLLPNPASNCPTRREIFPANTALLTDTYWQTYVVNSETRQLATFNTPASLRSEFVYFIPPPEAMDWWRSNGQPLPPTEYDTLSRPEVLRAVRILQPVDLSYVGGQVDVRGSIELSSFQHYQLAYGEGVNPLEWFNIGPQQTEFAPGTSMGVWDTSVLGGIYVLRLSVLLDDGSVDNAFAQVTVDNTPPVVTLAAGEPGQTFAWPRDSVIPIQATVTDNLAIERVEFYHNGILLGVDRDWPYGFEFTITRTGLEIFSAVAFDRVGNSSSAELEINVVRSDG